jgi:hypothetical protein
MRSNNTDQPAKDANDSDQPDSLKEPQKDRLIEDETAEEGLVSHP